MPHLRVLKDEAPRQEGRPPPKALPAGPPVTTRIEEPRAEASLVRVFLDLKEDQDVRWCAAGWLLGRDPRALDYLLAKLESTDRNERRRAARRLRTYLGEPNPDQAERVRT